MLRERDQIITRIQSKIDHWLVTSIAEREIGPSQRVVLRRTTRERKSKKRFRMENVQILKEIGLFSKV